MTPLHLQMLLHYYGCAVPYAVRDPEHANSPAVLEYRNNLVRDDLLVADDSSGSGWRVTPRGRAYVDALCALPLPICKWVSP